MKRTKSGASSEIRKLCAPYPLKLRALHCTAHLNKDKRVWENEMTKLIAAKRLADRSADVRRAHQASGAAIAHPE